MYKDTTGGPLFLPAAIFSIAPIPFLCRFVATEDLGTLLVCGLLWGVGIGLWAENSRRGGEAPWKMTVGEFVTMVNSCGRGKER